MRREVVKVVDVEAKLCYAMLVRTTQSLWPIQVSLAHIQAFGSELTSQSRFRRKHCPRNDECVTRNFCFAVERTEGMLAISNQIRNDWKPYSVVCDLFEVAAELVQGLRNVDNACPMAD